MSRNMQNSDIRTLGFVLRRTNYGEADRILNILTPNGKKTAIAKSARKEKSKLAGGIELFTLSDFNLHIGKSEFATVTGVKMIKYYDKLLKNYKIMEEASSVLKKISVASDSSDNPDFFQIVRQIFEALDSGVDIEVVDVWFKFNLAQALGEDVNLYRDVLGDKLEADKKYVWDFQEKALREHNSGDITANEIKLMRLLLTNKLGVVAKIKNIGEMLPPISSIAKSL